MTERRGATAGETLENGLRGLAVVIVVAVAALVTRGLPYLLPGQITAVREYDDGVMLGGAMAMLAGNAPYSDFFYLHPPGSLVMLTPAAAASAFLGEPGAMALARVFAVLVGVANTLLIALLLRGRGTFAMFVGAGLYAAWPVVVATERTILLEPVIVLGLLIALILIRHRTATTVVAAGVVLGLTTTVKVWAIVDVAIIAAVVCATMGGRMLIRFASAAAVAIAAVCLPFFLRDPAAMWNQIVVAQLTRAGTQASISTRLGAMSPAQGVHAIDLRVPWQIWLLLFIGLLLIAVLPLVNDLRKRTRPGEWADASWWAIITVVHALVILISSGFFYHYAVWLLAPLCLSVGYSAGYLASAVWRAVVATGVVAVLVATTSGALRHPGESWDSIPEIAAWAATRDCVWADSSRLIAADALRRNLSNDCPMDIDTIGAFLVLGGDVARETDQQGDSKVWRDRQWSFLLHADGVILPQAGLPEWVSDQRRTEFSEKFVEEVGFGVGSLWGRKPE